MRIRYIALSLAAFILSACGPVTYQLTRMEYRPYADSELSQEKDGVLLEVMHPGQPLPSSFSATVQMVRPNGYPAVDQQGNPLMTTVFYSATGESWIEIAITNNTGHTLHLNGMSIRLFSPDGSATEPLDKDDLASRFRSYCGVNSSCELALSMFRSIPILVPNSSMEIVPSTTATAWVAFAPPSLLTLGTWKYAFYDVPTKTDDAGVVKKTENFEIHYLKKKFINTYRKQNMFDQNPQLLNSVEVTN